MRRTRKASEITTYVADPFRGNKRHHAIAHKIRGGMTDRKIAKHFGVPLAEVTRVREMMKP